MALNFSEIKKIIQENKAEIKKFGVKELYIFGSVVRGESHKKSDVDIFVVLDKNVQVGLLKFISLNNFLSKLLGRKVDLATKDALHPRLKAQILKEAQRAA